MRNCTLRARDGTPKLTVGIQKARDVCFEAAGTFSAHKSMCKRRPGTSTGPRS